MRGCLALILNGQQGSACASDNTGTAGAGQQSGGGETYGAVTEYGIETNVRGASSVMELKTSIQERLDHIKSNLE
jgi:hypothetical protein